MWAPWLAGFVAGFAVGACLVVWLADVVKYRRRR